MGAFDPGSSGGGRWVRLPLPAACPSSIGSADTVGVGVSAIRGSLTRQWLTFGVSVPLAPAFGWMLVPDRIQVVG